MREDILVSEVRSLSCCNVGSCGKDTRRGEGGGRGSGGGLGDDFRTTHAGDDEQGERGDHAGDDDGDEESLYIHTPVGIMRVFALNRGRFHRCWDADFLVRDLCAMDLIKAAIWPISGEIGQFWTEKRRVNDGKMHEKGRYLAGLLSSEADQHKDGAGTAVGGARPGVSPG